MQDSDYNMKKIGIFSGYYLPHLGGVERYTDKLSAALRGLGYEIVIITSNHGKLKNYEVVAGRTIYRLPILDLAKNRYPIPKVNSEYRELKLRIENEKIDYFIVNTRFHLTSLVGSRLAKRLRRPVMLIEHGTGHFTVNNRWLDYLGSIYEHCLTFFIKRNVTKFYGVSNNCNKWLKHFSIQANGVFHNAVNPSDKNIIKDLYKYKYQKNEIVVTFAGRLIKEKGILNLISAYSEVKMKNPKLNLKLVIAGDGDLLEGIKQDYNNSSIDILGKLNFSHVMALYKRTDIFVYPSLYPEGLPTSILEAGLMGCALVATPRGGTEEVIIDKQHGIIVDGSKKSLCEAIELLATNAIIRKKLAKNVKTRIENVFNWDTVAKEVVKEIKKS
jgi:glycosyltransferase involved in cell wall biosynthesis